MASMATVEPEDRRVGVINDFSAFHFCGAEHLWAGRLTLSTNSEFRLDSDLHSGKVIAVRNMIWSS